MTPKASVSYGAMPPNLRESAIMQRVWASGISPTRACVVAALVVLPAACVWACEGLTVAMALFENRRDVHSLLVIGPENDPLTDADYERLRAWSSGTAEDLNLAIQRISTDDPAVVWSDHGFEQAPDTTRLTVLVARHPASALNLVVDRWDPAPTDEDLEVLRESPLRERLRIETIANLAVLVHVPGADAGTPPGSGRCLRTSCKPGTPSVTTPLRSSRLTVPTRASAPSCISQHSASSTPTGWAYSQAEASCSFPP